MNKFPEMIRKFIILAFIVSTYNTLAQSKFQFELSTGLTLSVPKTSYLAKQNTKGDSVESSLNIGGSILSSLNYMFNDKSSLDFGLGFSFDRFSVVENVAYIKADGNRNLLHIQIPVNYNFHFGKSKTFVIGAGAFANVLLLAKEKGDMSIREGSVNSAVEDSIVIHKKQEYEKDIKNYYNTFSLGAFIQLKKYLSFSSELKGFIFLKVNQHINMMNKPIDNKLVYSNGSEKEPTIVNLGLGIKL